MDKQQDTLGYEMVPDMRPDEYDELGGDEQPLDRQDNRSRDTGVPKQIIVSDVVNISRFCRVGNPNKWK